MPDALSPQIAQAYFEAAAAAAAAAAAFNPPLVVAVGVEQFDELEFPPMPPNCPPDDMGTAKDQRKQSLFPVDHHCPTWT